MHAKHQTLEIFFSFPTSSSSSHSHLSPLFPSLHYVSLTSPLSLAYSSLSRDAPLPSHGTPSLPQSPQERSIDYPIGYLLSYSPLQLAQTAQAAKERARVERDEAAAAELAEAKAEAARALRDAERAAREAERGGAEDARLKAEEFQRAGSAFGL